MLTFLLTLFSTFKSDIRSLTRPQIRTHSRKTDISVHDNLDRTTFSKYSLMELETKIAVVDRQAKLTTLPFTVGMEASLAISELSEPLQAAAQLRKSRFARRLGAGAAENNPAALRMYHQKKTSPALLRLLVLSFQAPTYTLFSGKSALSSHRNVTTCREQRA